MNNLWPALKESDLNPAKAILEEQAKYLVRITKDTIFAEVEDLSNKLQTVDFDMHANFIFSFNIIGKFLPGYKFRVLTLSHNIIFYPVKVKLDLEIAKELRKNKIIPQLETPGIPPKQLIPKTAITCESQKEFEDLLESVLNTERIKMVIGSLLRLSK